MDANTVGSQELRSVLDSFKSDISAMIIKFSNMEEERSKKLEKAQNELFARNNDAIKELKITIQKLGNIIAESSEKSARIPDNSSVIKETPVSAGNTAKLLETFNTAMDNSAKMLCEFNSEIMKHQAFEITKYMNSFSELLAQKTDVIIEKYTKKLDKCFEEKISQLSDEIKEHTKLYISKNSDIFRDVLADVQRENNNEIQKLSHSVYNMSESNEKFIIQCTDNNEELKREVSKLVNQHNSFISELKSQTDYNLDSMNKIMSERIDDITYKLEKLELKNAENFHYSMNEYRQKFVEASAEALSKVQVDLRENVKANLEQISKLTDETTELADLFDEYMEKSENSANDYNKKTLEVLYNIRQYEKDANSNISGKIGEISNLIENVLVENEKIHKLIHDNTDAYNSSLQQINEGQRRISELSSKDIDLLERMMKSNGL